MFCVLCRCSRLSFGFKTIKFVCVVFAREDVNSSLVVIERAQWRTAGEPQNC